MLTDAQKVQIIETLTERLKRKERGFICPMCGHDKFVLLTSYIRNQIVEDFTAVPLGGPSVPAVAIVCQNCGFISQHALGTLNLLPSQKEGAGEPAKQTGGV